MYSNMTNIQILDISYYLIIEVLYCQEIKYFFVGWLVLLDTLNSLVKRRIYLGVEVKLCKLLY